jgi:hypothetical protein
VIAQSFTNCYPVVFGGCTTSTKIGPRVEVVIASAKNRFALYDEVCARLDANMVIYTSGIQPSISRNIETLLTTHENRTVKIGFKPSGGSAGVGAHLTAAVEQAQVIYCALAQERMSLEYSDVVKTFNRVSSSFKITDIAGSIIKKMPRQWQLSCQRVAQVMQTTLFARAGGKFVFHRGTGLVTKIDQTFTRLNNKMPPSGKFSRRDKWNPADIWAIRAGATLQLAGIKSIEEFNAYLREMMNKQVLYGISLKMSDRAPTIEYVNVGGPKSSFEYVDSILFYPGKNLLSSKSAHIFAIKDAKQHRIELRSHKNLISWNAEIAGKTANHGKISYDRLTPIVKDIVSVTLPTSAAIRDRILKKDQSIVEEIWTIASEIGNPGITHDEFYQGLADKTEDWLWSRYLGIRIIKTIKDAGKENQDKIVEAIMSYASSSRELSAPFVKVS